jgi:uncharacterized protein
MTTGQRDDRDLSGRPQQQRGRSRFQVFACSACGHVDFPRRLLCPRCGTGMFRAVDASEGHVEETTVVRHRAGGGEAGEGQRLATVRTTAGPRVIARLDEDAARGDRVELWLEANGAIQCVS